MDVTKHLLRTELYIGDPLLEALVPFIEFGAELYIGDPFLEARVPFLEFGVEQRVGDLFFGSQRGWHQQPTRNRRRAGEYM